MAKKIEGQAGYLMNGNVVVIDGWADLYGPEGGRAALMAEVERLKKVAQVACDALALCEHANDCMWYDEEVDDELDDGSGTGPWDTTMKPGPCTCGKEEALSKLAEAGITPTK